MPHRNKRHSDENPETTKPVRRRSNEPPKPHEKDPGFARQPAGTRRKPMEKRDWEDNLDDLDEDFEDDLELDDEEDDDFLDDDDDDFLDDDEDDL
jgi:hypothetical protein